MKKAFVSILRLGILVGVLWLIPSITKGPQASGQCQTFNTETLDCASCCTKSSNTFPNEVVTSNGTGIQSIQVTPWSCGTAVAGGCSVACSGDYPQAVPDGSCCIVEGSACDPNEPCCPGTSCSNGVCTAPGGGGGPVCYCDPNNPDPNCCGSPIILDISGKGFVLTSAQGGVEFDIAGTSHPVQIAWTASGADNAFLCLPDENGRCDDGKDLFGNFTPQPPSPNPNGFLALAVYDQPANGGNGDGIIDARDKIFSSLRLWVDANHDGICQPEELFTLPAKGVDSISLKYHASMKRDQFGNLFRYRSRMNPDGSPDDSDVGRIAYDVFLTTVK